MVRVASLYEVNEASTLIQGAAHEEANIIFGAVIDDEMPEDEMRVTVIATGLDHDRVRRGRGRDTRSEESVGNVTHLRRESSVAEPSQPAAERLPVPERFSAPELAEHREARVAPAPPTTALDGGDELISPFAEGLNPGRDRGREFHLMPASACPRIEEILS